MSEEIYHLGIKAFIRNSSGDILLLKVNPELLQGERRDYWDLPGGRVQKGHSVLDTLQREVAEETGITQVTATRQVGMVLANIRVPLAGDESAGLILAIYECQTNESSSITLSDEHVAYDWFVPAVAAELLAIKYPEQFCELVLDFKTL